MDFRKFSSGIARSRWQGGPEATGIYAQIRGVRSHHRCLQTEREASHSGRSRRIERRSERRGHKSRQVGRRHG